MYIYKYFIQTCLCYLLCIIILHYYYIRKHTKTYVRIHTCMRANMHIHARTFARTHVSCMLYTYVHIRFKHMHAYMHFTDTHAHTHTCISTCIHECIYAHNTHKHHAQNGHNTGTEQTQYAHKIDTICAQNRHNMRCYSSMNSNGWLKNTYYCAHTKYSWHTYIRARFVRHSIHSLQDSACHIPATFQKHTL